MHLLISWVLQPRPDGEQDNLFRLAALRQQNIHLQTAFQTMSSVLPWRTFYDRVRDEVTAQISGKVKQQVTQKVTEQVNSAHLAKLRKSVVAVLRARLGEPPAEVIAALEGCMDFHQIAAAVVRAGTTTTYADFHD